MVRSNLISISVGYPNLFSVKLTNTQNADTPSPFQQMLQLPVSQLQSYTPILASDFHNVRFVYNGVAIPAWLESISNGVATIWVKLPVSIPANSSITIDMEVDPSLNFDGVYWGEAPELSPTYSQYDNGASVFSFYDNFAGTSLNTNKWTSLASVYTIDNGLQITATPSTTDNNFLESVSKYSVPLIIDIYRYTTNNSNNAWFGFSFPNTFSTGGVLFYDQLGWSMYKGSSQISGGSESLNTWYIQTGILAPNGQALENINYNNVLSSSTGYYSGTSGNINICDGGGRGTIQWLRTRAYPPNGVMPSVEVIA